MKVVEAIAEILKREGVEFLSTYPTTPLIDAVAAAGIRPVLCRQERVGVGIADGFTRTSNGRRTGVFAMQYGPGAENAFPGVATAYSDSVPMLVLPLGHQRDRAQVFPLFSSAVKDLIGPGQPRHGAVASEARQARETWLEEWMPELTSNEVPITPYRIIWDFMHAIDPREAIVTHDSDSPRNQMVPFYRATAPRSYMGWGKSHALGTGLGLIMGAKLAAPDKFCVNFMGDAAFGMRGLDFETAVRCGIPITTIVLNNSAMAIERHALVVSHDRYRTRDIGGNYADMGRAMGGSMERVEKPAEIVPALQRARKMNEDGKIVLLEFITSEEIAFSHRRAL